MTLKIYCRTLLLLSLPFAIYAQPSVVEKKTEIDYTKQKAINYDIDKHITPVSNYYSDWKSLVSVNESGDGVITVPLFEVKGRRLTMPISLNYVTSGIKVEQKSSSVGLGWTINFGSIIRDYGAFEPDYSYTGSEFKMESWNNPGNNQFDRQLTTNIGETIDPMNHNKKLDYTSVTSGIAPDEYNINVPGLKPNSFWNKNSSGDPSNVVNFVFTEQSQNKISYSVSNFSHLQEVSRINELDLKMLSYAQNTLDPAHNYASAIGFYPYVKNHSFQACNLGINTPKTSIFPSMMNVTFEDYSKFVITTTDGTKYVFAYPLKAQKYLIEEEPFWSSFDATGYLISTTNPSAKHCYGEFWKTEYVAEWLLTAVLSNDYVDVNNNNEPDDLDKGDWIKITYSTPSKEWLNFTQTDKSSSLWRERAYVTTIVTPVQEIDVQSLVKFDIDFDYFNSIFNVGGSVGTGYEYYKSQANSNISNYHDISEKYYTDFEVKDRITPGNPPVNTISLQYALRGSADQLCVSNYMIIQNFNGGQSLAFTPYNPENLGDGWDDANFYNQQGRGKTTLKAVKIEGNISNSSNALFYKFTYGKNPSYNDIHKFQIRKQAAFPGVRESYVVSSPHRRWSNVIKLYGSNHLPIANSILPWKWLQVDHLKNITYGQNTTTSLNNGPDYFHPVLSDEMGYYPNSVDIFTHQPIFNRDAWSLSEIEIPYGGTIKITYENDDFDIANDRKKWKEMGIADYCIPSIGHFNNIAHMRSIQQSYVNSMEPLSYKKLIKEYYYLMNQNSGGLRIKQLEYDDKYNSPIIKSYTYGPGHYTSPPADYWQNYLKGLGAFIYDETTRRYFESYYAGHDGDISYNDYFETMLRHIIGIRIDNSVIKQSKHYYEYIDETLGSIAGNRTRSYYGRYLPDDNPAIPNDKKRLAYYATKDVAIKGEYIDRQNFVELLFLNIDNSKRLGNYKTEYYKSNVLLKTESYDFEYSEVDNNMVTTKTESLTSSAYMAYAKFINSLNAPNANVSILDKYMTAPADNNVTSPNAWLPLNGNFSRFFEPNTYGKNFYIGLGYTDNGTNLTVVDNTVEAKNSLMSIGISCGSYTNPANWFQPIANMDQPWSNLFTTSQMNSTFNYAIHDHMKKFINGSYQGLALPVATRYYNAYSDEDYIVPAGTVKTQQSYLLRPKTITTTLNY